MTWWERGSARIGLMAATATMYAALYVSGVIR